MGNSAPQMLSQKKKVLIVGGSFGGQGIVKLLRLRDPHFLEITVLDKSDHFEFNCTNYKSLCDEKSFRYLSEPFTNVFSRFNSDGSGDNAVKYVQGRLTSIDHEKN